MAEFTLAQSAPPGGAGPACRRGKIHISFADFAALMNN
jgi:hypothetical protein